MNINESVEKKNGNNSDIYEVNLIEVVQKIWKKWKFILKVMLLFICWGIFQFFYQKENPVYTVEDVFMVNTGNKSIDTKLSGDGDVRSSETMLPLSLYPTIVFSSPFLKEIVYSQIKMEDSGESIAFAEFCAQKKYQPLCFRDRVRKYTIGLPMTLKGEECSIMDSVMIKNIALSKLKEAIKFNVNVPENLIILSVCFSNSLVAEQIIQKIQEILPQYISEFNLQRVEKDIDFLQKHYTETIQNMLLIQNEQTALQGKPFSMDVLQKYKVLEVLGTELGVQLEQAKIQLEKVTPVFKLIDSTVVRTERNGHGIMLFVIMFAFLGGFVGMCLVLILPFVAQKTSCKFLSRWLPIDNKI